MLLALATGCGPNDGWATDNPPTTGPGGEWTQWRGPSRDGKVIAEGLLDHWGNRLPRVLWRRTLGAGFGGLAVADDRALVLHTQGRNESLSCLDARSGETVWELDLGRSFFGGQGNGPRTTPLVVGDTVFAVASRRVVAVALADGTLRWSRQLDDPPQWGFSSSPLLDEGRLIFHGWLAGGGPAHHRDPAEGASASDGVAENGAIVALDPADGTTLWTAEPGHPGYASPLVASLAGRRQVVSFIGSGLVALDPSSGERLWDFPWATAYGVNAADPVLVGDDRVFVSSGYDSGSALVRVHADGESLAVEEIWRQPRMKNHFSSSVVDGDVLYGFDTANLVAFDLETTEHLWRQRGFGKGSLVLTGDRLLVLGEEGLLALVEATPDAYRERGKLQILDHGSWTPPTLAGTWLLARDHHDVVCLDLGE